MRRAADAVIVAVDPSVGSSGYAIVISGVLAGAQGVRPVEWGAVPAHRLELVEEVLARASRLAKALRLPVVMIGEEWGRGGRLRSIRTAGGLAAAWSAWAWSAKRLGGSVGARITPGRTRRVHTSTWRAAFGIPPNAPTDRAKRLASAIASRRVAKLTGVMAPSRFEITPHDAAEALLIGIWATRATVVRDVLSTAKGGAPA